MDESEIRNKAHEVSNALEYSKWAQEIPYINFPSDWNVKIIPNYGGAIVRFLVVKGGNEVSVYLDCYNFLGYYGAPYWEVYPHDNDVYRCGINEVDELLEAITHTLNA
tara:strand:- start:123 stop:446 length:324 start_codon:yes stop_codon:yes gene_type:complete